MITYITFNISINRMITTDKIVFTEMFRDMIKRLPRSDISNLCKLDKYFKTLCQDNRDYITRELSRRQFYVKIDTDFDTEDSEIEHTVTVTKTEPTERFGDFFQTHVFETLDYDHTEVYVLFHFMDIFADLVELFTDKNDAEREFYNVIGGTSTKGVIKTSDSLDFTVYGEDIIHRWRLVRVMVTP